MMKNNKYPTYYYLILVLLLLMMLFFWTLLLSGNNPSVFGNNNHSNTQNKYWSQDYLPREVGKPIPIDSTKIKIDTINNRKIIANIVNIALKDKKGSIAKFTYDFKEVYPSDEYKIVYIDSVVNRIQIELPESKREQLKLSVKDKLNEHELLVWDETLFEYSKTYNDTFYNDNSTNWYYNTININKAWETTTGNSDVLIAVVDNGFDLNHPELKGKYSNPYNVINQNNDVSSSKVNHGTHVASTIVANANNNEGIVGICPDCSLMPIKVEDENGYMTNSYIIDAILYAIKNNADVINLSLGMSIPNNLNLSIEQQKEIINSTSKDEEEFWNDIFSYATANNTICVLAAGNSNISTGIDPFQRSKNTIKVGAIDKNLQKAPFSNFGAYTTIYAPGTNIIGAKPNNNYELLNGTSMAAPIISGVIGLLKSQNKNYSLQEIQNLLIQNSKQINNLNYLYINNSI